MSFTGLPSGEVPKIPSFTGGQTGEVRATTESGGQKGQKPERYDLIPTEFLNQSLIAEEVAYTLYGVIADAAEQFWVVGDTTRLLAAAGRIVDALGGYEAARLHLARVYGIGALKYSDDNWRKGYPWSWSYAALWRHLEAWHRGEYADPETGQPHLAHVWWHLCTLWTFHQEWLGTDDSPKGGTKGAGRFDWQESGRADNPADWACKCRVCATAPPKTFNLPKEEEEE